MLFWVLVACLGLAAAGLVCWPLLRRQGESADRLEYDLVVFRDQLDEIDRDLGRGLLSEAEAEAARHEVERRVLAAAARQGPEAGKPADAGTSSPREQAPRRNPGQAAAATAVALVLLAGSVGVYLAMGRPDQPGQPLAERLAAQREMVGDAAGGSADGSAGGSRAGRLADMPALPGGLSLADVIPRLQERIAEEPTDLEAWRLLARTLSAVGRHADAVDAYRQALSLPEADQPGLGADLAASLGEAIYQATDGMVTDQALAAFRAALERAPGDPRARYYVALGDAQRGRVRAAMEAWVTLSEESPGEAPWQPILRTDITRAAMELGLDPMAVLPSKIRDLPGDDASTSATSPPAAAPAQPGPDAADMAAAAAMAPEDRQAMIRGMVEGLQARLDADPADIQGWLRLIRAWTVLGERQKAVAALAAARAAHGPDAEGGSDEKARALEGIAEELGLETP